MTVIDSHNYETYLLRYIDGELNADEQAALMRFLRQHPGCRKELELLQATKLVPDETIRYSNRAGLYRHSVAARPYRKVWWLAAAAVLGLLSGIWWMNRVPDNNTAPGAYTTSSLTAPHAGDKGDLAAVPVAANTRSDKQPVAASSVPRPTENREDTASYTAADIDPSADTVTFALLTPLKKATAIQEPVMTDVSAAAIHEVAEQWEIKLQDISTFSPGQQNTGTPHEVVITISGHSSNPLMSMVSGVTHVLAKMDQAYQKIDQYKITSVRVGK
jgi:hypothetical protein